jgi:hypothetical protein
MMPKTNSSLPDLERGDRKAILAVQELLVDKVGAAVEKSLELGGDVVDIIGARQDDAIGLQYFFLQGIVVVFLVAEAIPVAGHAALTIIDLITGDIDDLGLGPGFTRLQGRLPPASKYYSSFVLGLIVSRLSSWSFTSWFL